MKEEYNSSNRRGEMAAKGALGMSDEAKPEAGCRKARAGSRFRQNRKWGQFKGGKSFQPL